MLELLLDLARGPALCPSDEVADGDVRRDFDEHMDVVARQHAIDDRHPQLVANPLDDLAHPEPHLAMQHLETIFLCSDDLIAKGKRSLPTLSEDLTLHPRKNQTTLNTGALLFSKEK